MVKQLVGSERFQSVLLSRVLGHQAGEEVVPRRELWPDDRVAMIESLEPAAQLLERAPTYAALPDPPVEMCIQALARLVEIEGETERGEVRVRHDS